MRALSSTDDPGARGDPPAPGEPLRRLADLADRQRSAFHRDQARRIGVTEHQLRRFVALGAIERVGPHVYRFPASGHGPIGDLSALVLDIGGGVWASGPTAAAVLGFDGYALRPPFHLTVLRGRDVGRVGHRVHTTTDLPLIDRTRMAGIPLTSGARTLIDLARTASSERLTVALDSALRDGFVSEAILHRRIVALRGSGRPGVPELLRVIEGGEVVRGGHSWLEREFLRLLAEAGLPRPATQQHLTRTRTHLVRVDCRFPGTPVIVELLGYRYHRTPSQLARDAERLNALVLDGFHPLQFAYEQVVDRPGEVVADVGSALGRAAAA